MTAKPKPMRSWTGYVLVDSNGDPLTDVLMEQSAIAAKNAVVTRAVVRIARVEIRELPRRKAKEK